MRALVTGGAGFIGSYLSERLRAAGTEVTAVDDLSTGCRENVSHLEGRDGFNLVVGTVLDQNLMDGLVRGADVVYHLASAVGVRLIIDKPVQTIETIAGGTEVVLGLARRYTKPVLITSSSEVYGKGSRVPFSEGDDVVLGPTHTRRWTYACAKMLDEFLALAHWYEAKLPVICVRLFNTVGPRQTGHYGMVLPRFVEQALSGAPVTVYGDGKQTRCFSHVLDVVGALTQLMNCPQALGRVINVGTDREITINRLAQRVIELGASRSPIVHVPFEKAYVSGFEDMRRRVPDLTVVRGLIGYEPQRDLDEIIRSMIEYQRRANASSNDQVTKLKSEL